MKIIYLDQFVPAGLRADEGTTPRIRSEQIYKAALAAVQSGRAIFPYSQTHIAETSNARDPETRKCHADFWNAVSGGYRFCEAIFIRRKQLKRYFHGQPPQERGREFVFKDSLRFEDNLEPCDPARIERRKQSMREVVEWWATLPGQTAAEKVRAAEAQVLVTYNTKLLAKALRGEEILPVAFDAEPNLLWAETSELLGIYGGNENAPAEALAYLAEHGGKIPAIELELHLMGQLAERYAPDGAQPSSVAKSKLQNDCGDFQALSNFLPYCDGGIFDIRATELFRGATLALNRRQYRIWAGSQTDEFVKWIDELPVLEPATVPSSEICALKGRVLLYVSMKPRRMIRRELIQDEPRIEILPQGGVAVSSESLSWSELYHLLEEAKMAHVGGIGDSGWVYAGNGGSEQILIKHCVTMGMFSIEPELTVAIEALDAAELEVLR